MSSKRGGARSRRVIEGLWVQQGFSFYSKCDERMKEGFNQDGHIFTCAWKRLPCSREQVGRATMGAASH